MALACSTRGARAARVAAALIAYCRTPWRARTSSHASDGAHLTNDCSTLRWKPCKLRFSRGIQSPGTLALFLSAAG